MAIERQIIISTDVNQSVQAANQLNTSLQGVNTTVNHLNSNPIVSRQQTQNLNNFNTSVRGTTTVLNNFRTAATTTNSAIASGANNIVTATNRIAQNQSALGGIVGTLTGGLSNLAQIGIGAVTSAMPTFIQQAAQGINVSTLFGGAIATTNTALLAQNTTQNVANTLLARRIVLEQQIAAIQARMAAAAASQAQAGGGPLGFMSQNINQFNQTQLNNANQQLAALNAQINAATASTGRFTAALRFLMSGFGAALVAIGLVTAALTAYWTATIKGQEETETFGLRVKTVWQKIVGFFAEGGEQILGWFTKYARGLQDTYDKTVKWGYDTNVVLGFVLEGLTDILTMWGLTSKIIGKSDDEISKLSKKQQAFRREKRQDDYDDIATEIKIAKLKEQATDKTNNLTKEQRQKLYKEAKELQRTLLEDDIQWAKREFDLYTEELTKIYNVRMAKTKDGKLAIQDTGTASTEQIDKWMELAGKIKKAQEALSSGMLAYNRKIKEDLTSTTTIGGTKADPNAEIKAKYKALQEELKKANKTDLELLKIKEEEELLIIQTMNDRKLISDEQYQKDKLAIEEKYAKDSKIVKERERNEVLAGTKDLNKSDLDLLIAAKDAEFQILRKGLEDKKITQAEYNAASLALTSDFINKQNEILYSEREFDIQQKFNEKRLFLLDASLEAGAASIFKWGGEQNRIRYEEAQKAAEIDVEQARASIDSAKIAVDGAVKGSESQRLAKEALLNAETDYANASLNLSNILSQKEKDKVETVKQTVEDLSNIFEANTVFTKGAKSAGVAIDTYEAANEIFNKYQAQYPAPFGTIAGAAAATATALRGASTIKKIWAVNKSTTSVSPDTTKIIPPQIQATKNVLTNTEAKLQSTSQKVYVVESDITNAQNKVKVVQNESSF